VYVCTEDYPSFAQHEERTFSILPCQCECLDFKVRLSVVIFPCLHVFLPPHGVFT
jgi:hypothetical protein